MKERDRFGTVVEFLILKAHVSEHASSYKTLPPKLPQALGTGTTYLNAPLGTFLIQTTTHVSEFTIAYCKEISLMLKTESSRA